MSWLVLVVEWNILSELCVSEPIQSENMKDTYEFFRRNPRGTHTVISDSKGEAESLCVWVGVGQDEHGPSFFI